MINFLRNAASSLYYGDSASEFNNIDLSKLHPEQQKEACSICWEEFYSEESKEKWGVYHYPNKGNKELKHIFHKHCFYESKESIGLSCPTCRVYVKNTEDFLSLSVIKANWKRVAAGTAVYGTMMLLEYRIPKEVMSVFSAGVITTYIQSALGSHRIKPEDSKLLTKQLMRMAVLTGTTAVLSTLALRQLSDQTEELEGLQSGLEWTQFLTRNIALVMGSTALGNGLANRVYYG